MGVPAGMIVLVALLAAAPPPAQTVQTTYSGRPIADVQLLIEGRPTTEPRLADLVQTRRGERLSMAEVRESITHLYSLGRFQDIQVEAIDAPEGAVILRYNLIPLHTVESVDFRGRLALSEGTLKRTMTERFGATPPVSRAAEVVRLLQQLYQDEGYFRADIRPRATEQHDPDRTLLTFEIDAGPRAQIGRIDVQTDGRVPREEVLRRLELAAGRPFAPADIRRRVTDLQERLKGQRHYDAIVNYRHTLSADMTVADVAVDVEAGPVIDVVYEGDPVPAGVLDDLVPIEREGSVEEDLLEDSAQRIGEYLRQQGYWKATVVPSRRPSGDRLAIVFTVSRGRLYRVADGIQISGNRVVAGDELRQFFTMAAGEPYVGSKLEAAAAAIRQLYITRGFAWVEVKPDAIETDPVNPAEGLVRPTIAISEGPQAFVGEVMVSGARQVPEPEVRGVVTVRTGEPFYRPRLVEDREAILSKYADLGFGSVVVNVTPAESQDRTRIDVLFEIQEGPRTLVGHVIVVGNNRTDEQLIRREVTLRSGEPLGVSRIIESRRNLGALGLFRRVSISQLEHGPLTERDVLIAVEEAPATTVGYGGGLEITRRLRTGPDGAAEERLEFAPRGFFEIGRRNLGGRNRSVSLYTRVSLRPKDVPGDPDRDGRGIGFSEYRVVGTYREPRVRGWAADFTLTGATEQAVRATFNFARRGVTAELIRRLTQRLRTSYRYALSSTRTFDERLTEEDQAQIDRLFPQVRLSTFSGALAQDTRDDLAEPSRGMFLSAEGSIAARALGGEVGYLKTYLQGNWFTRLPGPRRIVLATRAALGLADGFPREAQPVDDAGNPIEGDPIVIEDLPASERFFAGGDTTIRGFAVDTVGAANTISPKGYPRGGNAVLLLNAELRVPVWRDLGATFFVDGGNVFARVTEFDFGDLRGGAGFGVRYRSPIGPIRVDLGFKLDPRGTETRRPVLHFSMGQAF